MKLDYEPPKAEVPRTTIVGIFAAIGFAGIIAILLMGLASLYLNWIL